MNFLKRMKINSLKKKIKALVTNRENNPVSDSDLKKEIDLYYELAKLYEKLQYKKGFENSDKLAIECYRSAAVLEDVEATYILSDRLMELGKFWDSVTADIFESKVHEKYIRDTYEEAFAYLKSAEEKGSYKAKRLHGLAYINGWGVDTNLEHGFKLVTASIEQEGAWDRATEILKELGLNKPEFMSYIMSGKD